MKPPTDESVEACVLRLCRARGAGKTICPSEAARALAGDAGAWRALMPAVRAAAGRLAVAGKIVVSQGGVVVDISSARGTVRLGLPGP